MNEIILLILGTIGIAVSIVVGFIGLFIVVIVGIVEFSKLSEKIEGKLEKFEIWKTFCKFWNDLDFLVFAFSIITLILNIGYVGLTKFLEFVSSWFYSTEPLFDKMLFGGAVLAIFTLAVLIYQWRGK